ncbi:MAG: hypothetical protein NTW30_05285 [Candidatus Aenigmarchaeota archaeon]|nr:hypothetical protein [Candidatus Aenigmarchaeota archaeon]
MEESFGTVKQNKVSVVHWLIVFIMIFGGLGSAVYQLLYQPMTNLTNPFVLLTVVIGILWFVTGVGVWNLKKWGLWLGLAVSIINIFFAIIIFSILQTINFVALIISVLIIVYLILKRKLFK